MDLEVDKGSSCAGSGHATPRSQDKEVPRCETHGCMPTYQYTKEQLYELEKIPASLVIPDCLEKEFIVDGVWDPEHWVRSFGGSSEGSKGGSRGSSPLTAADPREKRTEMFRRNSGCERLLDLKERLKEEKDGIILSPQRRSFGTGCHVSQQPLLQRALSNMEADRDRRDGQRRIGSGRIQMDHNRAHEWESDFRNERSERDREFRIERGQDRGSERDHDFRSERPADKESRDIRNISEPEHDHDCDYHKPRDRFEREDRDKRPEQNRVFSNRRHIDDRHRDRRDFQGFNNRHNNRNERCDRREEEPEWFSGGPSSKSDTIELHGFDREREQRSNDDSHISDGDIEASDDEDRVHNEAAIGVADRNGILETNKSSSPETNQLDQDVETTSDPSFDFNEFFNVDSIPGLLPVQDNSLIETDLTDIGGSRFYQLYRMDHGGLASREHSRRSSVIEDEFSYLNDILNGSRSPLIPSPPPPSANLIYDSSSFLAPFASSDKQHHLEFGTVGQKFGTVLNHNAIATTLLNNTAVFERSRSNSTSMKNSHQDTENKLKAILFGNLDSTLSSGDTTPGFGSPLNLPGKVKTVAELEFELQRNLTKPTATTPLNIQQQQQEQNRASPHDLTAFNKLIHLMQAGSATPVESPKTLMKVVDHTPLSSLTDISVNPIQTSMNSKIPPHQQMQPILPQITNSQMQVHHSQQERAIIKHAPFTNLGQTIQNERGNIEMVDGFNIDLSTPTLLASLQYSNLSESSIAQKQFMEALYRNKEQQLQIHQATMLRHPGYVTNQQVQNQMQQQTNQQAPSLLQQMVNMQQQTNQQTPSLLQQMVNMQQQTNQQTPSLLQHMVNLHQQTNQQTPSQLQQLIDTQQQTNQQTPLRLQQMGAQGQRSLTGDAITGFFLANPTIITKSASPTPPPLQPMLPIMTYVAPGSTPRGPSPNHMLQSALQSHQAHVSPRVPSPIMFSQQPPMHLNAPSPIHPINGSQSPVSQQGSSMNTIRPPVVPRVLSPQELVMHTQAILQNALIKKQLEDQKERFYKKHQERVKSPNPIMGSICANSTPEYVTSTPPVSSSSTSVSHKTSVNVAFTPTSVMKKMHNEKADEKERDRKDGINNETLDKDDQILNHMSDNHPDTDFKWLSPEQPSHQKEHQHSPSVHHEPPSQHHHQPVVPQIIPPTSIPPPSMMHMMPPPPLLNQVLPSLVSVMTGTIIPGLAPFNTNQLMHFPPTPPLVSTHLPMLSPRLLLPPHPPTTSLITLEQMDALKSQQIRALIGQQIPSSLGSHFSLRTPMSSISSPLSVSGRPIVKGNPGSVTPMMVSKELMTQWPITGNNSAGPQQQMSDTSHVPRSPLASPNTPYDIQLTGSHRLPMPTTPLTFGSQPPTPFQNQVLVQKLMQGSNQRNFNNLSTLHTQQEMIDPHSACVPLQQGMTPKTVSQPPTQCSLNPQMNSIKNGPISPGPIPVTMVTVSSSNKGDNLMKWFSTDILKTSLPNMPPLPVHGQHVLTLDEIERS